MKNNSFSNHYFLQDYDEEAKQKQIKWLQHNILNLSEQQTQTTFHKHIHTCASMQTQKLMWQSGVGQGALK